MQCHPAFSCSAQSYQISTNLWSMGYHTFYGSNTSINGINVINPQPAIQYCLCHGAFACNDALNITSFNIIACTGTNSCYNINNMISTGINCHGANSCLFSKLMSSTDLLCGGYNSCSNSHIYRASIYAEGAFSLQHSIIFSNHRDINIHLRGFYSGFNTTIICYSGDTCNIYCFHDLCSTNHKICNDSCLVEMRQMTIDPINSLYQSKDEECSKQLSHTRDDYIYCSSCAHYIGNGSICCRAEGSCIRSDLQVLSTSSQSIICSASASCQLANITKYIGSSEVLCSGYWSCKDSIINAKGVLYCLGRESCHGSNIYNTINVTCGGTLSCGSASIHTQGSITTSHIYFLGHRSGYNAEIYCARSDKCSIFCYGFESCLTTTLRCIVTCSRNSSCPVNGTWHPTIYPSSIPTVNPIKSTTTRYPTAFPVFTTQDPTAFPTHNPASWNVTYLDITSTRHKTTGTERKSITADVPLFIALLVICIIIGGVCGFLLRSKNEKICCICNSSESKLADIVNDEYGGKVNNDKLDVTDTVEVVEMTQDIAITQDDGMEGIAITQEGVIDNVESEVILKKVNDANDTIQPKLQRETTKGTNGNYTNDENDIMTNDEFIIEGDDAVKETQY